MKLIWEIRDSIYGPAYYQGLLAKPFSYSLKYFFTLAILIALITSVSFLVSAVPAVQSFLANVGTKILEYYPEELEIAIKNGVVSTNIQEPYFVKLPQEFRNSIEKGSGISQGTENLFVIDTKTPFTVDQFKNYRTLLLITKDSIVHSDGGGKITIQSLAKIDNFTINKIKMTYFLNRAEPYFKFIYPIIAVASFFLFLAGICLNLSYLLFIALLIWLIARIKKIKIGYGKSFQLGLHLVTAAIAINSLLFLIAPQVRIPFLFTAIVLIAAIVNIKAAPEELTYLPA